MNGRSRQTFEENTILIGTLKNSNWEATNCKALHRIEHCGNANFWREHYASQAMFLHDSYGSQQQKQQLVT
jgi:hypothetical protein